MVAGYHWRMPSDLSAREDALQHELRTELTRVDTDVAEAIGRALERDDGLLLGGAWSGDDDQGCLLTLAARDLGPGDGEALLRTSVAAVRIPALFDELWALTLARTGDARTARAITHRLVVEALASRSDQEGASVGEAAAAVAPSVTARSARPR